jgi:hypothetical protein
MKRPIIFFKTGCSIIGLHSNTCTKDYDHSLMLVCTRGVFGYWVMTGGGAHVYVIYKGSISLTQKKNNKTRHHKHVGLANG